MIFGIDIAWFPLEIVIAAALAGLVRGFAGFGAAMVFMPIAAAVTTPEHALVMLFLIGTPTQLPFLIPAMRSCVWREVAPLALGATIMVPVGVALLLYVDPAVMRIVISLLVLSAVAALTTGWRYQLQTPPLATAVLGSGAGLGGGMAGLYGPVVVLFWLGGQANAPTVRANLFAFFGVLSVVEAATFLANGMITAQRLSSIVLLLPIYGACMWLGSRLFGLASESVFRRIALVLCASAALLGLMR